jgi:hypothetical protein
MTIDWKLLQSQSSEERKENASRIQKEYEEQRDKDSKFLAEFLLDARKSPKLTDWEKEFVRSISILFESCRIESVRDLSERQKDVVKKLEAKIHAIG